MTEAYRITGRRTHVDMRMLESSGKLLDEVDTVVLLAMLLATRVKQTLQPAGKVFLPPGLPLSTKG